MCPVSIGGIYPAWHHYFSWVNHYKWAMFNSYVCFYIVFHVFTRKDRPQIGIPKCRYHAYEVYVYLTESKLPEGMGIQRMLKLRFCGEWSISINIRYLLKWSWIVIFYHLFWNTNAKNRIFQTRKTCESPVVEREIEFAGAGSLGLFWG